MHRLLDMIYWTPSRCRWNTENPPQLTIWLNLLYAAAGGFMMATLFYSHPILDILAHDFGVGQAQVANIPTLAQAGDATGLVFILPLADFFPRRRFTLTLSLLATLFWLGLCFTTNVHLFSALTYLSACFAGVCQILMPLVTELSPPDRRAFNISIVGTGPTLAILLARILSGIVANYTSWRYVYFLALGLQVIILVLLFLFMPDYPSRNPVRPTKLAKTYPKILCSILQLYWQHPVLLQASFLSFCTFFCVASFWTTLTFLLSASPYNYSTLVIGLFGLVGASTMVLGPVYARFIIQPLKQPLYSVLIGVTMNVVAITLGTFLGKITVVGPIIYAFLLDGGLMVEQIANRCSFAGIAPGKETRLNTAFMAFLIVGQLCGTKLGNTVYAAAASAGGGPSSKTGNIRGWYTAGGLSLGVMALSYVVVALRGPGVPREKFFGGGRSLGWVFSNDKDVDGSERNGEVTGVDMEKQEVEVMGEEIAGEADVVVEIPVRQPEKLVTKAWERNSNVTE